MSSQRTTLTRRELLSAMSAAILAAALPNNARSSSSEESMHSTVLVTGGTGYIGGWCIAELLNRGYTVRTTIRSPAKESSVRAAVATVATADDRLSFAIADLTADQGWDAAVAGCDYVLHVASPLGGGDSNNVDSFVTPARDGTLRVLRAASRVGVKRVVMTSAATAATPPMSSPDRISDETVWFDPNEAVDPYRYSKRLAERAAWDFMKHQFSPMTLTTVLPGAVFGPILSKDSIGSADIIRRLLQGRVPANPHFAMQIVDVRDLVDLHIRAMTSPQAAGERFLGVGEFMWMADISRTLRSSLGDVADKVPTRDMPDWLFRLFSVFEPTMRAMTPRLGKMHRHTAAKAQRLLQWQSRPAVTTLVDCAESLIAKHVV
jgi:nucleoside-diphosphate-sugar epimerase